VAQSRVEDQLGRILGDRYQLIRLIGSGASGYVFLAEDARLGRKVAVKLLQTGLAGDEAFLRRFRAEARGAAAMSHPHIMGVLDWGEEDDGPYLVLEYLKGGSLRDLLDGGHHLSVPQAVRVALEAAGGLAYAHRRGVVHRDIKPANLLFDEDGRLSIADFGLARALAEAAWTEPMGSLVGTVRYSSPEAAQGRVLDGRADVYALGLVLIEAVSGTAPFASDTAVASLMARVSSPPVVPAAAGVLGPVLVEMTRVDPDERLEAHELVGALESLAGSLPRPEPLQLAGSWGDSDLVIPGGRPIEAAWQSATTGPLRATGSTAAIAAAGPAGPAAAAATQPAAATRPTGPAAAGPAAATRPTGPTGPAAATGPAGPAAAALPPTTAMPITPARSRRRHWVWGLALLIAALVAGGVLGARALLAVTRYHTPDIQGLTPTAAAEKLKFDKFHLLEGTPVYSSTVRAGDVAAQQPSPGKLLAKGSTVRVELSKGPAPVAVPPLAGLTKPVAVAHLVAVGLTPKLSTAYSETVPNDEVISYTPSSGLQLPGTTVDVTVSLGPRPRIVPSFAPHTSYAAAVSLLQGMGLVASKTTAYSDTVNAGDVIGSSPLPGASVPRGSTVTLTVSLGPHLATIPNVYGETGAAAATQLNDDGFHAQVFGPDPQGGSVLAISPPPGQTVHYGATVDVFVL
jgi:beta-lactam-binding protein with PASTA domain